jgi:putative redox protein
MAEEWKEVGVEWVGESSFLGRNLTGGCVQIGTIQGQPGLGPMELLLLGVAGCTGMDVVSILGKKRQKIEKFEVNVKGKRAETHPRVFTEIEVIYQLWGDKIESKMVEQAIRLSEEKYCSASAMLSATANIRSNYIIHQLDDSKIPV